ncbi:conserved hypothetical protein [Ricinus communis]|uniref:Uncharacterized protein n=1 Tax=Ricinus communis TaxID=3988 RepID=B9SFP9_RICCO|nr:conserved hypothetical protein [Ricinus communis]
MMATEVELARTSFSYNELVEDGEQPAMAYEDFTSMLTTARVGTVCWPTTVDPRFGTI